MVIKEDTHSMPGSLIEPSGEPAYDNESPAVVCADDEYKSQKSDEFADVKVEAVEEQGKVGDEKIVEKKNQVTLRRDPEEEFFMLAILAHKMQHIENQETEFIYQVDSAKLFEQVKENKLPFHKWYAWLDTKFQMMKVAFEQEQEDLYNDPSKNPEGLVNPYKKQPEATKGESTQNSSLSGKSEDVSPFGIIDKIRNFIQRQTSDEKEEEARRERERQQRINLLGGKGSTLKQSFQYKTQGRAKNFSQFQKPILSTKSEEIFALGQPFSMKKNFLMGD